MSVIEMHGVSKVYGFGDATTVALDGVSLNIDRGEFVAIMGPSGSGKSTLLNLIGLLDTPTHGQYRLDGRPVGNLSSRARARIRREQIGFIFQSFNLLPRMTVIDNVSLPLMYAGVGSTERLERASVILRRLGLGEREYYYPNQLSGGQAQRVAVARAIANNPSIILADEPTGNLDSKASATIMKLLKDLNEQGNTLIMVTHSEELAAHAGRLIKLEDGRVVRDAVKNSVHKTGPAKRPLGGGKLKKVVIK